MKRQFMKGLMALCVGVMTLGASSSLFVSCDKYDDSELREQIDALDKRVQNLESVLKQLEELTARVDALYTLKFQVTTNNELQYSFDGGNTWVSTGIVLATQCDHECPPCQYVPCDHECPEVSLVDNGDSVTIKVGDAEFTIEKPEQIVFELRAGKVYFSSEATSTVSIKSSGIEDITVMSAPKGWYAEINAEGKVEITAPNYDDTQTTIDYETWTEIPAKYAASGYVKVHACSVEGKCMVGRLPVEVVEQALSVKAYGGNAYFTVATDYEWGPTYFYGVATKETLEAETAGLLKAMSGNGWDHYDEYANTDATELVKSIAELYGEEPQMGTEYVVWAVVEDNSKSTYTAEDLVIAYYSPLQVAITEVAEENTVYNVTVNVEVEGAEGYVAVAMPELYCDDPEYNKEQMAMALSQGEYYGKFYTENYSGSALDIAAGTTYSMTGLYSPASDVYVFVLPIDGRPVEDYTAADVTMAKFTTAGLTSGGSIDLNVAQMTEYMGEVYDYDIWEYVEQLIKLDPYTQLGVEASLSANGEWSTLYYNWMDEATYADYGAFEEDIVDYLLENSYGNTPADVEGWPLHIVENTSPATTLHFVGFVVDKDGKYGKVAHLELTTQELKKADYVWAEPYTTNLQDGVLKNSTTLKFTPVFEGGKEAASYKYVLAQTKNYNQYEGMDDAQMAEELYFSTSSEVKTVSAEELVNGVLYVDGHKYGYPYYFAIVPIDAEGNPGASAAILEYETVMVLDEVITEGADFEATRPEIKINCPTDDQFVLDGWLDGAYYSYQDQTEYGYGYYITVELNYDINPVEGTEVSAVLFDATLYVPGTTPAAKAGQVWSESLGWYHVTTDTYFETSFKMCTWYLGNPIPDHFIYVSWKDAEGNVYFEEYDITPNLKHYNDLINAMVNGGSVEEFPTPDGKQWAFTWMQMGGVPTVLDFGVTLDGQCVVAYDPAVMGAPEGTPYQIFNMLAYEFVPTDATSGKLVLTTTNMFGEELSQEFDYSNLTENSCHFEFDETSFVGEPVDGTLTEVVVDMSGGVM